MKTILLTAALMVSFVSFAMGSSQHGAAEPQHGAPRMSMMQNCPMNTSGAEISVADTTNGVSLTITTKTGDVAELRRRSENMAKMHSAASGTGMHGQMMMPFEVKYEDVADGSRLTLTPKDPARLEEFRTRIREHVEAMKKGDCSMMQGMMMGMMPGMMGGPKHSVPAPKAEPKSEGNNSDHSGHHPVEETQ